MNDVAVQVPERRNQRQRLGQTSADATHTLCLPNVYTLLPLTLCPSAFGTKITLWRAAKSAT
jgi:hypothetical protein